MADSNKTFKDRRDVQAQINQGYKEQNNLTREFTTLLQEQLKTSDKISRSIADRASTLETMIEAGNKNESLENRLNILKSKSSELEEKLSKARDKAGRWQSGHSETQWKTDKKALDTQIQALETQLNINNALADADSNLLGGMVGKTKDLVGNFSGMGMKAGLISAGLAGAVAILISFSGKLDKLGEEFGAIGVQSGQLQSNLLQGEVAATRLGKSLEDVIAATTAMTDDFGITLSDASALSGTIVDTGVAIGVSSGEAGKLMGTFKEIVGLSSQQSDNLIKQTYLLATATDVAPRAVMADIAGSTETVAKFTHAGGENIARAAIQARRLGTTFDSIASAAEGMLDFESSIAAEIEAQVFTGRQLNLQRARELSLAGDLEGLQKEITAQVGSEAEFNAMNVLQRQSLAKALGMSVADISKIVSKQGEAVTLAGQLAGQPGFDELVGAKGVSTLTQLTGTLKSLGASLTNSLGPALNIILSVLTVLAKGLEWILKPFNMLFQGINAALPNALNVGAPPPSFAGLGENQMATMTAGAGVIHAGEAAFQIQSMNNMIDSFNTGMDKLVAATETANTQRSDYYADADTRARRTGGAVRRSFESGVL